FLFFFASRRRHTSSKRDWSSDVCSSDLLPKGEAAVDHPCRLGTPRRVEVVAVADLAKAPLKGDQLLLGLEPERVGGFRPRVPGRSEERRVGKRWRALCARYACNEKRWWE